MCIYLHLNAIFMHEVFTNTIIERRKLYKFTQAQMAKRIGVSRRTYSNIENGKMTLDQLLTIASHLNLKVFMIDLKFM